MTAHEEQDERIVGIDLRLVRRCWCNHARDFIRDDGLAVPARDFAASVVAHSAERHLDQPSPRIVGNAVARPLSSRRDQRFLHCIFGGSEVVESPDDRAEHVRARSRSKRSTRRSSADDVTPDQSASP